MIFYFNKIEKRKLILMEELILERIKTNIMYNLLYQILILFVHFVTTPYLSRILGAEGIGVFSYVSSIAYYFFLFITLGLNNYGSRCIAKCEKNKKNLGKTFFSIYTMQLIIGIFVTTIYCLYFLYVADIEYKLFYILYLPYILSAIIDINWFYYGLTEFKFTTIRSAVIRSFSLVLIFTFVKTKENLGEYFCIMALTCFLSNLLLWTRLRKYISFYKPSFHEIFENLKPNLLLFVPILAMSIYRVMDKIMIKELSTVVENGYYENADKIITMVLTSFSAVATVMMPSISGLLANGNDAKMKQMLRDFMQASMALGIGMMFGLLAVGSEFAPLFFGEEYYESGIIIQFLAVTVVLAGWKTVLKSQYLIPYEKDSVYVVSLVAGAIINVICNLYFIPKYAARGAAVGTVIAELVGFFIQTIFVSKAIEVHTLIKDTLVFLPAGLVMFALSFSIVRFISGVEGLILAITVGIISYIGLAILSMILFQKKRWLYFLMTYLKRS